MNALFLRRQMLSEHLDAILRLKLPYEPRIPKLARNTQVFTTPHERVGFAGFCSGGDARGIEVFLFATGDGNETTFAMSMSMKKRESLSIRSEG